MSKRFLLVGLAVAVAGALAFLIISANSEGTPRGASSSLAEGSSPAGGSSGAAGEGSGSGMVVEVHGATRTDSRPRRMKGPRSRSNGLNGEFTDYVLTDGTHVRDHRTGDHPEPDLDRSVFVRAKRGKVSPDVIVAVRRWLRPRVTKCSRDYESDIGETAKVDVRLLVSIRGRLVTVAKTVILARNVSGGDFTACVEQAVGNMELSVGEHEDVEHHMLTFPFGLPVK